MNRISKSLIGTAAAALMTVTAAAPAQAQYYGYRDYDRGIDVGDIAAGVAIVGGIAAIASALGSNNRYDPRYAQAYGGYGYGSNAAVNACVNQAQRYGRGRVRISDVRQRSARGYVVSGTIGARNGGYGYDRNGHIAFNCDARDNGRITDFDTARY